MLEHLASIASIVSAFAIVVSVIYAALQIRQNTSAVTVSALQQVMDSFAEISFEIGRDKALCDLVVRANRDFGSLPPPERLQFTLMTLSFTRRAENVFLQSRAHVLTADHWVGIRNSLLAVMDPPGARACWAEIRTRLNPDFRLFVDQLLGEQPAS